MVSRKKYNATLFRAHTIALAICTGGVYLVWGVLFSLLPPFYPREAEAKGATPSQVQVTTSNINLFWFRPELAAVTV